MQKPNKWNREHQPWCAFVISVNNGGPIFNQCDCAPKIQKPPLEEIPPEIHPLWKKIFASSSPPQ